MASVAAAQRGALAGLWQAALPSQPHQRALASMPGLATGAAPGARAAAAAPPPGRASVAARAATQMRPLPNLVGGLKSLRDISIDITEEDMSAIELRNVNVRRGWQRVVAGGPAAGKAASHRPLGGRASDDAAGAAGGSFAMACMWALPVEPLPPLVPGSVCRRRSAM